MGEPDIQDFSCPLWRTCLLLAKGSSCTETRYVFSHWTCKDLESSRSAVSRSNCCLQATNEKTLCLGFTHLWSNLLKSLIRCNILPSSYWFLSLLLPFTMMWTTFWCHVIFFCTEKIWGFFGLLFLSCRYLSLFQGKKMQLDGSGLQATPFPTAIPTTISAAYWEIECTAMHT